jgi:riboflavin transporter FmnP
MIGTFCYGPIAGIAIEFIKIAVKTVIKGTQTAFVGEFANFVIGCSLVVPAGIIYQWKKTKKSAIMGMALGTIITAIVGCFINAFVLLPTYATAFGMPVEAIVGMGTAINASVTDLATFAILLVAPFNIVKGVLVSIVTFLLYKRISSLVKGAKY